MLDITQVYLITGFLGSGKTTFLNRVIHVFPKDLKLTLLVNEFGEVGVDGVLVEGDDIDMMEISKGSIFCVCVKTDFIKGLYELNTTIKPDVMLIESTGVANPTDLKKDLKLPIFNDRFQFKEQFCLIDAAHFLDAYNVYASLEKQIASSTVFILNKTDVASPEQIAEIKDVVHRFHPDPVFHETMYADIPLDRFFDFDMARPEGGQDLPEMAVMSPEELDAFIDDLLDSPNLEMTPPDLLVSAAYQWKGADLSEIEDMAKTLPRGLIRAKGFVRENGAQHVFNYVMGDWTLAASRLDHESVEHQNVIVFIGPPDIIKKVENLTREGQWENLGVYQPYQAKDQ